MYPSLWTHKKHDKTMEAKSSAAGGRVCGYRYMAPSYAVDDDPSSSDSYLSVSDALLENSSAHGLPTLYRARGVKFFNDSTSLSVSFFSNTGLNMLHLHCMCLLVNVWQLKCGYCRQSLIENLACHWLPCHMHDSNYGPVEQSLCSTRKRVTV